MARQTKRFTANGMGYELRVLSGTVEKTEQRSDTIVSGGGGPNIGDGRTHVSVSSTVVVRRDIWIRTETGEEVHLRHGDTPVREGNYIHQIWLAGPELKVGDGEIDWGIINASTGEAYGAVAENAFRGRKWIKWFLLAAVLSFAVEYVWVAVWLAFFVTVWVTGRQRKERYKAFLAQLTPLIEELRHTRPPVAQAAAS